jgi:UDP-N-acetylmuramoylalanine-D-glutamate ligase
LIAARSPRRIDRLPDGEIHAVGAASLECASMVRYLIEGGCDRIVLHDVAPDVDAAFAAAHRFQPPDLRERALAALRRCGDVRTGGGYLAGIDAATSIVIPVSWFLYPENASLAPLQDRFVTFPDACFDLYSGPVVGVTGSYGKTTTSRFTAVLLDGLFCGNDRESFTDLGAIAAAPGDRGMAFEASNRHLRNGFRRTLDVGVLTAVTLNHEPDHGSFRAYRRMKYTMATRCRHFLYHCSIPDRFPDAAPLQTRGISYGVQGAWRLRGDEVRGPGGVLFELDGLGALSPLERDSALAAAVAAIQCGIDATDVAQRAVALEDARARYRHSARTIDGRLFVNDAASCMPAATAALVAGYERRFTLICGGDRQRYRDGEFDVLAWAIAANPVAAFVFTMGPMAPHIEASLRGAGIDWFTRVDTIAEAVTRAVELPDVAIVFSPGCGVGTIWSDKYERGEEFDAATAAVVPVRQATL